MPDGIEKPTSAYVTCIGATNLTEQQFSFCDELGFYLCEQGFSIRSGRAPGADQGFQRGMERSMNAAEFIRDHQIFLPWERFEKDNGFVSNEYAYFDYDKVDILKAETICATVHPVWEQLTRGQRLFHIRNVFQILGPDCETPSDFVIACAFEDKDGLPKGGTRTAYKIAVDRGIPAINIHGLSTETVYDWIENVMKEKLVA